MTLSTSAAAGNRGRRTTQREGIRIDRKNLKRPDPSADSTTYLIYMARQITASEWEHLVGDKLTPRQYHLMQGLRTFGGPASQSALVEKTGIDRSTLSNMVRRMVAEGLLQARSDKGDGRLRLVDLSAEGKRVLRSVEPLAQMVDAYIESAFGRESLKELHRALNLILNLPVNAGRR